MNPGKREGAGWEVARQTRSGAVEKIERLLLEHGIATARVEPAGHDGDIAAIVAAPDEWSRIIELTSRIKECGFRYVALDLEPAMKPEPTFPVTTDNRMRRRD